MHKNTFAIDNRRNLTIKLLKNPIKNDKNQMKKKFVPTLIEIHSKYALSSVLYNMKDFQQKIPIRYNDKTSQTMILNLSPPNSLISIVEDS